VSAGTDYIVLGYCYEGNTENPPADANVRRRMLARRDIIEWFARGVLSGVNVNVTLKRRIVRRAAVLAWASDGVARTLLGAVAAVTTGNFPSSVVRKSALHWLVRLSMLVNSPKRRRQVRRR